jgi:hypothetical protein
MASNPALRDRETRGSVASTKRFILTEELVDRVAARAKHDFPEGKPGVLYSAIDPSGGGAGSDYAIVTLAFNGPCVVVSLRGCGAYTQRYSLICSYTNDVVCASRRESAFWDENSRWYRSTPHSHEPYLL